MITNDDVREYLDNIRQLEIKMNKKYHELAKTVDNAKLKKNLENLADDEKRHRMMITGIIDQFEQDNE